MKGEVYSKEFRRQADVTPATRLVVTEENNFCAIWYEAPDTRVLVGMRPTRDEAVEEGVLLALKGGDAVRTAAACGVADRPTPGPEPGPSRPPAQGENGRPTIFRSRPDMIEDILVEAGRPLKAMEIVDRLRARGDTSSFRTDLYQTVSNSLRRGIRRGRFRSVGRARWEVASKADDRPPLADAARKLRERLGPQPWLEGVEVQENRGIIRVRTKTQSALRRASAEYREWEGYNVIWQHAYAADANQ